MVHQNGPAQACQVHLQKISFISIEVSLHTVNLPHHFVVMAAPTQPCNAKVMYEPVPGSNIFTMHREDAVRRAMLQLKDMKTVSFDDKENRGSNRGG